MTTNNTAIVTIGENQPQATRAYDVLKDVEREKVDKLRNELDYHDSLAVIRFGSSSADDLSQFTSNLFKGMKVSDFQEFENSLSSLMHSIKQVDPDSLQEVQSNKWKNWPIIGRIVESDIAKKVNQLLQEQTSVEKVVETVTDDLERTKLSLMKEMELINQMKEKCYDYAIDQELIYIALEGAKTDAKKELLQLEATYNSNDLMEVNRLSDMHNAVDALDRKGADILVYRTMSLQNLPKLNYIYNAEEAIVHKIEDVIHNVIPIWRQQFAMALFSFHVKNAAFVLQTTREATEAIYKANGLMLEEALTNTLREVNALPVSFEALKEQNNQMIKMFDNLVTLEEKMKAEREKNIPEIIKIQENIVNSIAKMNQHNITTQKKRTGNVLKQN